MDTFQIDSTLEELSACPVPPSDMEKNKLKEVEVKDPQVISGHWVDKNGVTLAVYFSWSVEEVKVGQSEGGDEVGQSEGGDEVGQIEGRDEVNK